MYYTYISLIVLNSSFNALVVIYYSSINLFLLFINCLTFLVINRV